MTLEEFAQQLFVHPKYLGQVVRETTGHSTCYWFETRLLAVAQRLLLDSTRSIADVARQLDYDPSNFTKFF